MAASDVLCRASLRGTKQSRKHFNALFIIGLLRKLAMTDSRPSLRGTKQSRKRYNALFFMLFFSCLLIHAIHAEDFSRERVHVHTDRDCYMAGEDVLFKFYAVDGHFQPSSLSKVGYIEICDTEKPHVQMMTALENGSGAGRMTLPDDLPTGAYLLTGYTRYMRNEGATVLFKKQIAVVNARQRALQPKRFELVESYEKLPGNGGKQSNLQETVALMISTDKNEYVTRERVALTIGNLPVNTADLVISVTADDSLARVLEVDGQQWLASATAPATSTATASATATAPATATASATATAPTAGFSGQWLPEYEGHIITGTVVPKPPDQRQLSGSIAFVGKDIQYFNGQNDPQNGTVNFYTAGVYGRRQLVTSVALPSGDSHPYRMDLVSPFCEFLPDSLPVLQIFPDEKRLTERYLGVQMRQTTGDDASGDPAPAFSYKSFAPVAGYDLDEYTRFPTIAETILEYVTRLRVSRVDDRRVITVYFEEEQQFMQKNTLVLLDGVPIPERDHEELLLAFNPAYIKYLNIYEGRYVIGGNTYNCIVSFVTFQGDLPFIKLNSQMQLFNYDCPQPAVPFQSPDHSVHSRKPDFRHTLYWNPFAEYGNGGGQPATFSFHTSDVCGTFKVTVEGITTDGKMVRSVTRFRVAAPLQAIAGAGL